MIALCLLAGCILFLAETYAIVRPERPRPLPVRPQPRPPPQPPSGQRPQPPPPMPYRPLRLRRMAEVDRLSDAFDNFKDHALHDQFNLSDD